MTTVNWHKTSSRLIGEDPIGIVQKTEFWSYYRMVYIQIRSRPREWGTQNSQGFCDTYPPIPTLRPELPLLNKKENQSNIRIYCVRGLKSENWIKLKERQVLRPCSRTKEKHLEPEDHRGTNFNRCSLNGLQRLCEEAGRIGSSSRLWDYRDLSAVRVSQNTDLKNRFGYWEASQKTL